MGIFVAWMGGGIIRVAEKIEYEVEARDSLQPSLLSLRSRIKRRNRRPCISHCLRNHLSHADRFMCARLGPFEISRLPIDHPVRGRIWRAVSATQSAAFW